VGDHVVGVTTCYDLRFPSLYRRLVDRDRVESVRAEFPALADRRA
jgi:predicted amidohydrolase